MRLWTPLALLALGVLLSGCAATARGARGTPTPTLPTATPTPTRPASHSAGPAAEGAQRDVAEVVRTALEWALVEGRVPDHNLLRAQGEEVVLSLENIAPSLVPDLPGVKLVPLSPQEVQRRADERGDFLYLSFRQLAVDVERGRATVQVATSWARAAASQKVYLSGGGCELTFTRKAGRWVLADSMMCWIS